LQLSVDVSASRETAPAHAGTLGKRQKKGPQLALEPLNGRGIAGYVPKP
jgi:hypothetical protein